MYGKRHKHRRRGSRIAHARSTSPAKSLPKAEPLEGRTLLSSVVSFPISVPPAGTGTDGLGTDVYVAAGPDGNIWFTEQDNNKVGKMTPTGAVTEFTLPTADSEPEQIIAGPDGALWFIESGVDQIGRITTAGKISEFTVPSDGSPQTLAAGPDGNVWFIDSGSNAIGKITPQGAVTEFPASADGSVELSEGIVTGSDGDVWFTAWDGDGNGQIDRMTTSGKVTTFPIDDDPYDMTLGPDGNLWVDGDSSVDRVTPQGVVTEFQLPSEDSPFGITAGPDGALWFGVDGETNNLGQITTSGAITEFALPSATSDDYLNNIVAGPGNSLWYATETGWQLNSFDPSDALLAGGTSLQDTAGATSTDTLATFTDFAPGSNASFYQANIDWGDGTNSVGTIAQTAPGQYSVTAPHEWSVGYFNVTVTITDAREAGGPGIVAGRTAVAYTSVEADAPTPVGTGIAVSAVAGQTFGGPVADFTNVVLSSLTSYSATIDWGDGHVTAGTLAPDGNGGVTVSGSEQYAASGTFTVTTQIYPYANPPIIYQPGPWEPIFRPIPSPILNGGAGTTTTDGSTGSTAPSAYSAGPIGASGSTTTTTTTHRPALFAPVAHTTSTTGGTKKGASQAAVVDSGGSGGVSGGTNAIVAYPPIDILPIWGQFPGIGAATATATVAAGAMNGTGYTVLPTEGQPFSDVIASFTVTDPNINLADLQATVQWSDPGIPQFGTTSSTTPVDATITSTGNGTFTVSATNTFADPGIYHFIVQVSDTPVGTGPTRLVGVAYGEAFVPYPPGTFYPIVDPLPVAWAGSTISAQTAAVPAGGATSGSGTSSSTGATYPALAEKVTAKTFKVKARSAHSFSGKLAVLSGVITPSRKSMDLTGTIDWGDGTTSTATFVRDGKKIVVKGKHTFTTSGAATITLNLSQGLTPQTAQSSTSVPPPPIHLPTVQDAAIVVAPKHARS